jgi:hypothetical protein
MHTRKLPVPILALSLLTVAAIEPGCGRSEAPATTPAEESRPVGFVPDTKPVPEARWVEGTVPKGTPIKLTLIDTLTSLTNHKGDPFRALVPDAIMVDGTVTVPSGSNVLGVVTDVAPAATGAPGKGGMVALEFNRIETPTGASAPLKAKLMEVVPRKSSTLLAAQVGAGAVVTGTQGREVVLMPTSRMTLVLEEPMRIKVRQ